MGTVAWRNWRARLAGDPVTERFEAALYSDARFYEDLVVGPYTFIPAMPSSDDGLVLAVVLRGDFHLYADGFHPEMSETDTSRYHGGTDSNELDDELVVRRRNNRHDRGAEPPRRRRFCWKSIVRAPVRRTRNNLLVARRPRARIEADHRPTV